MVNLESLTVCDGLALKLRVSAGFTLTFRENRNVNTQLAIRANRGSAYFHFEFAKFKHFQWWSSYEHLEMILEQL